MYTRTNEENENFECEKTNDNKFNDIVKIE